MDIRTVLWGIIIFAGFLVSYELFLNKVSEAALWISWAVLFNIGNYMVWGKMKKAGKAAKKVWLQNGIFGLIATIIISLEIISINYGFLMSLWFLLTGSALLVSGYDRRDSLLMSTSIIISISSIFMLAFGNSYFLAGALLLGLLITVNGVFSDKAIY